MKFTKIYFPWILAGGNEKIIYRNLHSYPVTIAIRFLKFDEAHIVKNF